MLKPPKGLPWLWNPSDLAPEIARLVARPYLVVSLGEDRSGGNPIEYARKQGAIVNGSTTQWVSTPYGRGLYFPNTPLNSPSPQNILTFRGNYPTTNATIVPHSVAILWQPRTNVLHVPFSLGTGSGSRNVGITGQQGSGFQVVHYGVVAFTAIGSTLTQQHYYLQLYSYDQVTMNHLVVSLNTGAMVSQSVAETRALANGAQPRMGFHGANEGLQGVLVAAAWVRGAWTLKEMEMIARQPTSIWTPRRRPFVFFPAPVAGGGGNILDSTAALPLGGSIDTDVAVQASSTQALPFGGNASAQVAIGASSASALPLSGSAQALVAVQAGTTQALPLGGTINVSTTSGLVSDKPLPLAGSASAAVGIAIISTVPLPLSGASSATVRVAAVSIQPLPLGGGINVRVSLQITTNRPLPLGGFATAFLDLSATILGEPLGLEFESLQTGLEFETLQTGLYFLDQTGAVMSELRLREGELVPIVFTLTSKGVPADLTNAIPSTIKWTVRRPGRVPIIDNLTLTRVAPFTSGKVTFTPVDENVLVLGKYQAEAIAEFVDGTIRKFPGEGDVAEVIIGPSLQPL